MISIPKAAIDTIYIFVGNTRNGRSMIEGFGDVSRFQAVCDFLVSREFSLGEFFRVPQSPDSLQATQFHRERQLYMLENVIYRSGRDIQVRFSLSKLLKLGLDPNGISVRCEATATTNMSYLERLLVCGSRPASNVINIVRCLLEADADPNIFAGSEGQETGNRLMHIAAKESCGDGAIFLMLLQAGGDELVVNRLGLTPMQYFSYACLTKLGIAPQKWIFKLGF